METTDMYKEDSVHFTINPVSKAYTKKSSR
jgi:hypothetical protein